MQTIEISGSYGSFTVHRLSGCVIDREVYDEDDDAYRDITYFDPTHLPGTPDALIEHTAFITDQGRYYGPMIWDRQPELLPRLNKVALLSYHGRST